MTSPLTAPAAKAKLCTILYDESCDPLNDTQGHRRIVLPDPPAIQQAPSRVPDLYPANRFTVSAILSNTLIVPKIVTLSGTLPDGSTMFLPPVKVCLALDRQGQGQGQDIGDLPPLIHTLAAHRIIQELEDGNTDSQGVFDREDKVMREVVAREAIVRLSERYQLASKFASFIAVESMGTDDDHDDDADVSLHPGARNGDDSQGNKAGKQRSAVADNDALDNDDFYDNDVVQDADVKQDTARNVVVDARGYAVGGWSDSKHPPSQTNPASMLNTAQTQPSGASANSKLQPSQTSNTTYTSNTAQSQPSGASVNSKLQPSQTSNPASTSDTTQSQPSGASVTGFGGSINSPSNQGARASQWSTKDATSSLPPPVVDAGVPVAATHSSVESIPAHRLGASLLPSSPDNTSASQKSTQTQTSHFVNAFTTLDLDGNGASHPPASIQRSASTRSDRGAYFLDTVANKDAIKRRSSRHWIRMLGADQIDNSSSSLRVPSSVASSLIGNTSDPFCLSQRMPGAYPHETALLSEEGADRLTITPSSGPRMLRTTLSPNSLRKRPQSTLYSLETAACIENAVKAVHFDLDQIEDSTEEDEEVAPQLLFTVTASFKTGLYKAPKKSSRQVAITPVQWTTGAPIIAAARLQSFVGSFELNDELQVLIGKKVSLERLKTAMPARLKGQQDAEKIWATVLAAAYLKKSLPDDKEVWIGLWNKAAEYVQMQLGTESAISFAALVDAASKLL